MKFWENRDVLCTHRPEILSRFRLVKLFFVGTEPLLEQNLVNHLFLGLNQYVNDHQELMMHLDTPLLVEILVQVADLKY